MKEKEMSKLLSEFTRLTVKCKHCNHSLQFIGRDDRVICSWCGNYIYKDAKTEFKYKMKGLRYGRTK